MIAKNRHYTDDSSSSAMTPVIARSLVLYPTMIGIPE
jgi:hypothetical protein